ncbi:MAG: phosphate ABC transporter permease PstA [Phycisphaerae bacterium]|nr:phosphate ABC transporter permease PstA [Phycisphaerae bacterium]
MKADRGLPASAVKRAVLNRGFLVFCLAATSLAVVILAVLIISITVKGLPWIVDGAAVKATFYGTSADAGSWKQWIRWEFFTEYASRKAKSAGILAPLLGSIWAVAICAIVALPLGVGTAIYLEEFAPKNRVTRYIETNIRNLSGVPSIVYGILGLTAFARMFGVFGRDSNFVIGTPEDWYYIHFPFGQSVLTGGLTLMLVILPIIIISSQEAFRSVPKSMREASLAMGATKWQTVWNITQPAALPMILTGAILAISRAVGEAAPLLVLGVPLFITSKPENLMSDFTVLPFQIFNWAGRPQDDFRELAAAAIIVLLIVLLSFNAIAVLIRQRLHRPLT